MSSVVDSVNQSSYLTGIFLIERRKVSQEHFSNKKMKKISKALIKPICHTVINVDDDSVEKTVGENLSLTIKNQFNSTQESTTRINYLTILKDWSFRNIQHHFPPASYHVILIATKITKGKRISSDTTPNRHPSFENELINLIINFH